MRPTTVAVAGGLLGACSSAAPLVRLSWLHPLSGGLGNANPAWILQVGTSGLRRCAPHHDAYGPPPWMQLGATASGGVLVASYIAAAVADTHASTVARKAAAQSSAATGVGVEIPEPAIHAARPDPKFSAAESADG